MLSLVPHTGHVESAMGQRLNPEHVLHSSRRCGVLCNAYEDVALMPLADVCNGCTGFDDLVERTFVERSVGIERLEALLEVVG